MNGGAEIVKNVEFCSQFPKYATLRTRVNEPVDQWVCFVDQKLLQYSYVKESLSSYPIVIKLPAGERCKDMEFFQKVVLKLQKNKDLQGCRVGFVCVGGGSLGDFVGFLASIYKRGVPLVQIPTTFLSMLDSAHGGKTALNVGIVKNQIGTFYQAHKVFIVRQFLQDLPEKELRSGYFELLKMAILKGGSLFLNLTPTPSRKLLWESLPQAIKAKCTIVKKDPYEKNGERRLLNLGHTFGHVCEAHYRIPHGQAVGLGLKFALDWSLHLGLLPLSQHTKILNKMPVTQDGFWQKNPRLNKKTLLHLLSYDKKHASQGTLDFIFICRVGRCERQTISLKSMVIEARRQGVLV